jgi:hypothetical protein
MGELQLVAGNCLVVQTPQSRKGVPGGLCTQLAVGATGTQNVGGRWCSVHAMGLREQRKALWRRVVSPNSNSSAAAGRTAAAAASSRLRLSAQAAEVHRQCALLLPLTSLLPLAVRISCMCAGKSFFKKKKQPIPVDLKSSDFPGGEHVHAHEHVHATWSCACTHRATGIACTHQVA